jgi:integrase
MTKRTKSVDPYKRHSTRHRGISFRLRADGSRAYAISFDGSYVSVEGGEQEALLKQAELRQGRAEGGQTGVYSRTTFGELAEEWFAMKAPRLRERTRNYYRSALDLVLLRRFGSQRLTTIDAEAISGLVHALEREGLRALDPKRPLRPLGHSSIDNYLKPLRAVLALAVRRRIISVNPFDYLLEDDRPKRPDKEPSHEWTPEEVEALLVAAQRRAHLPEARYDYTPLIRLTSRIGVRLGETLGLRWEDFDRDEGVLHIRRQWLRNGEYGPTKTPAGVRRIPLPPDLRDELIAFRLRSPYSQEEHPIFASHNGTPLRHRNVTRRGFEPAAKEAGLDVTFHDLRDAAASRLINGGLDPVTVAAVLGHEDATVTLKIYAHLWDRRRTDEAVRLALSSSA